MALVNVKWMRKVVRIMHYLHKHPGECAARRVLPWTAPASFLGKWELRMQRLRQPHPWGGRGRRGLGSRQVPQLLSRVLCKAASWVVGCLLRSRSKPFWSYSLLITDLLVTFHYVSQAGSRKWVLGRKAAHRPGSEPVRASGKGFLTWQLSDVRLTTDL